MRWGIAAVAAASVLTACGSAAETADRTTITITTTTTTSAAAAMDSFRGQLQPVLRDLGNGLKWVGGAAQSLDMADLRAACRSLAGNVDQLEAVLPSPDALITQKLNSAVSNWRQMASMCQGASLRMTDADFTELRRLMDAGDADLTAAVDLIKQSP